MIEYKLITDIKEAENIWKNLSSEIEIFDVWEFRILYYQFLNYPLHFLTAWDNTQPVALLPLMINPQGTLEFFGSTYMSYNPVFTKKRIRIFKKRFDR